MQATGMIEEANRLALAGDTSAAAAWLRHVPPDEAEFPRAMGMLADLCLAEGRLDEASLACERGLEGGPEATLLAFHAEALLMQGRPEAAAAACREALRLDPESFRAMFLAGRSREAEGRLTEAMRFYEHAIRREPDAPVARYYFARALAASKDYARAGSQLFTLLQLAPHHLPGIILRAEVALGAGDPRQAVVAFARALRIGPMEPASYMQLAEALLALADPVQALRAYEDAIAIEPTHWPAYQAAANVAASRWFAAGESRGKSPTSEAAYVARRYLRVLATVPAHRATAQENLDKLLPAMAAAGLPETAPPPLPRAKAGPYMVPQPAVGRGGTGPLSGSLSGRLPQASGTPQRPALPTRAATAPLQSPSGHLLPTGSASLGTGNLPIVAAPPPIEGAPPAAPAAPGGMARAAFNASSGEAPVLPGAPRLPASRPPELPEGEDPEAFDLDLDELIRRSETQERLGSGRLPYAPTRAQGTGPLQGTGGGVRPQGPSKSSSFSLKPPGRGPGTQPLTPPPGGLPGDEKPR